MQASGADEVLTSVTQDRFFFPTLRASVLAGVAVAAFVTGSLRSFAQTTPQTTPQTDPALQTQTPTTTPQGTTGGATDSAGQPVATVPLSPYTRGKKKKADPADKVLQSKDTKKAIKKDVKVQSLAGADAKLPDKQLYDKALVAMNKGHFDVARLDLQTMLNTYPDSQYQMRAKLAIADSWYKEGGTAALTQAESEYADFRVFFPNAPEAAEAQMRIGDIYFRQMDKPDRDYAKTIHAEEEYRRMLTDYPNAPKQLMTQAKQRLREVQEVLATREATIAGYYASRENWAAVIARYQTVADTYPLYSHMDDALVGLGDAYEAQARYVRGLKVTGVQAEAGKARLEELYDGLAADQYRKVVLEHSAAPHVEDARERLEAMSLPVPTPTAAQVAASEALENSRSTYTLASRAKVLFLHQPDTVVAARDGDPALSDPKPTTAPAVLKRVNGDFKTAFTPAAATAPTVANGPTVPEAVTARPATTTSAAPLALQEVGTGVDGAPTPAVSLTAAPAAGTGSVGGGTGLGVEIVPAGTPDAVDTAAPAAGTRDANYGLRAVGPVGGGALPAVEKAAPAPDPVNEVDGQKTPAAQALPAKGKAAKPEFDKADESSSKHKKKKGLKKLDPLPQ